MTRKYGAKKDANHAILTAAIADCGGFVMDISSVGCGVPDLIVWDGFRWLLVEIKNPKTSYGKKGLNKLQKAWETGWQGGKVNIVRTIDDVVALMNESRKDRIGQIMGIYIHDSLSRLTDRGDCPQAADLRGVDGMKTPKALDQIADLVLAFRPKPKSKPARKRARRRRKEQVAIAPA